MAIVKPDLTQQWASDGDKIAPSGAKIQAGWGPEIPPYQWENFIQNRQDEMLAYLNERGIPEWDNRTNYVGGGKSYVQGSDGKVYKSVAASGPASVVSNPTTDVGDTYWTVAFADVGAFLTQATGDTRYTQRSNNLRDLTNVATARTNLGLGTAATKNAQTSPTDTTAGALMAVGAFGLGDNSGVVLEAGTNLNNIRTSGLYGQSLSANATLALNYPIAGAGTLLVMNASGTITTQTYIIYDTGAMYTRGGYNGTWSAWRKQIDSTNALGENQTWQDVTASRVKGTTYTNTTGRPIQILVQYQDNGINGVATFKVDSLTRTTGDLGGGSPYPYWFSAVIPNGNTYSISGGVDLPAWWELR